MLRFPAARTTRFALGALALLAGCSSDLTSPSVRETALTPSFTTAASVLLIDTGPGQAAVGFGLSGTSTGFPNYQFLAGKFTLSADANLDSVEGWMKIFGAFGTGASNGVMNVHIRADNSGLPGNSLYTKAYTVAVADFGWYVFSSFTTSLAAGTYWLSFEPEAGSGIVASMPNGVANPLSGYAFQAPFLGTAWSTNFGSTVPTMGFRVSGSLVTPQSMIGDLRAAITASNIPAGNAQSINSKLQLALNALANNSTAAACAYLQDAINYTKAQTGKKISASVSASIISQLNAIRTEVGC